MIMRIGIFISSPKEAGGVYQYSLSLLEAFKKNKKHKFIVFHTEPGFKLDDEANNWKIVFIKQKEDFFSNAKRKFAALFGWKFFLKEYEAIKKYDLDLMLDPATTFIGHAFSIPYIVNIHDLMHKYYPSFPEYSFKVKIMRDLLYKKAAKYSKCTVVESAQGKEDLARFYGISKKKIKVIPCVPSASVYRYRDMSQADAAELTLKYKLPDRFIFYPAQFWHHKNHIRLMQALNLIKREHKVEIPIVLAGSPKESYKETMDAIDSMGLKSQVFYLGYVPDKEIAALYKRAEALVFPSLLGHTNIPPLEAIILGTPVLCSDLFEMPKQVGDAGLLFNPFDSKDIAEKVYRLWEDKNLRMRLKDRGFARAKNITSDSFADNWNKILESVLCD